MSLQNKSSSWNSALLGASLAVIASVPLTAWLGSLFGNTYNMRVAIYGGLLLWVLVGTGVIVFVTWGKSTAFSFKLLTLWFVSTWLWPIPLVAWWLKQKQ